MEPRSVEAPSTSEGHFSPLGSSIPHPRPTVAKKLLKWRQSDEAEKWAETAVSSLVKKLKDTNKGSIKELQRALSCPGAPSECVTIPQSSDGRLQILHRKALPHVIYCRVWRWPDLQSHHELRAICSCKFAYSKKLKEVCINPYHYTRVNAAVLPPVMVAKHTDFVPDHSLLPLLQLTEPITPETVTSTEDGVAGLDLDAARFTSSILQPQNSNLVELQPRAHNSTSSDFINDYEPMESQPPPELMESQPPPQSINYEEKNCWASIAYYELNHRVGESFECKNTTIIVDGFTNPDRNGNRFCLGQLSNIHRDWTIERARKNIGDGIHLYYVNGQVFVECLSNASIFVQSKITNYLNNFYPLTVCKITPGSGLKIFDSSEFAKMLSQAVNCNYESVYQLTEVCIVRISFVNGWGAQYGKPDITSTPAWIEIRLHESLNHLDRALSQMDGPTDEIDSDF